MLVFAYDGSLNGDWVAHYAMRFAANTPSRVLRLIHVADGSPAPQLQARTDRIAGECRVLGVKLELLLDSYPAKDVAERILAQVPARATLIAGTRAKPRDSALLARTVSARLLEARRCPVIALRVVQPGVLGQPGSALLPLTREPGQAAKALRLLRLLGADLHRLHLLLIDERSSLRLRTLSGEGTKSLLADARRQLAGIEEELRQGTALHDFELDSSAVVSDDIAREILDHARKFRSRLICLGADNRPLTHAHPIERVLRAASSDVAIYGGVD